MKVRRFVAGSSREALKLARDALGPDAVLLSSRRVDAGMEILALAERDIAGLVGEASAPRAGAAPVRAAPRAPVPFAAFARAQQPATTPAVAPAVAPPTLAPEMVEEMKSMRGALTQQLEALAQATAALGRDAPAGAAPEVASELRSMRGLLERQLAALARAAAAQKATAERDASAENARLASEVRSMRSLLAESLAGIAWNDAARRQPLRVATLKKLVAAGYSASLARELVAALPEDLPAGEAVRWLAGALAGRLVCAPDEAIVDSGGVYALVGPTGVGKTTTTAKLAARAAMKFGARRVALVSTDAYRIGAHEQLRAFGRILGVPVHAVQDPAGLAALAAGFADKHVVLIDTVGMGQRDDRVAEQRELLAAGGARRVLLLNASGQGETLEDVVAAYGGESLVGCIVTKIDEAVRLAPVLDTLMRHRLPLHFVANGQRVPEDLHAPNTAYLLHRSLKDIPGSPYRLLPEEEGAVLGRLQLALGAAHAAR